MHNRFRLKFAMKSFSFDVFLFGRKISLKSPTGSFGGSQNSGIVLLFLLLMIWDESLGGKVPDTSKQTRRKAHKIMTAFSLSRAFSKKNELKGETKCLGASKVSKNVFWNFLEGKQSSSLFALNIHARKIHLNLARFCRCAWKQPLELSMELFPRKLPESTRLTEATFATFIDLFAFSNEEDRRLRFLYTCLIAENPAASNFPCIHVVAFRFVCF